MSKYFKDEFDAYLAEFKKSLRDGWNDSAKKLETLYRFQTKWKDVEAAGDDNFPKKLNDALDESALLFGFGRNGRPIDFLVALAKLEAGTVRDMFKDLFDESKDLGERVENFRTVSRNKLKDSDVNKKLRSAGFVRNDCDQSEKYITTYLWLRYPDKYYIYKYEDGNSILDSLNELEDINIETKKFSPHTKSSKADEVEKDVKKFVAQVNDFQTLCDKLNKRICEDEELVECYKKAIEKYISDNFDSIGGKNFYDDINHVMLTIHIVFNVFNLKGKSGSGEHGGSNKQGDNGEQGAEDAENTDNEHDGETNGVSDSNGSSPSGDSPISATLKKDIKFKVENNWDKSRNLIVFGAPGTGKSYYIEDEREKFLKDNDDEYERVTFYPDYSYANFVGTYKPVPAKDSKGEEVITYKYVPGPFMRVLVKALRNCNNQGGDSKPYILIIEEINRANAAAVFGDVFQLLDRDGDGVSMYPIQVSEDMKKYLADKLGGNIDDYSKIKIPNNMFIWATMNSADQGVYPLDTAFKRRWDFKYIGIDDKEEKLKDKNVRLGKGGEQIVEWNALRKAINKCLADNKINEDKQLGPFYINTKILDEVDSDTGRSEKFIAAFKDKVLMYLFEDAGRQIRSKLFKEGARYSEICNDFDEKGIYVFSNIDHKGLIIKDETGPSGEEPSEGNS